MCEYAFFQCNVKHGIQMFPSLVFLLFTNVHLNTELGRVDYLFDYDLKGFVSYCILDIQGKFL